MKILITKILSLWYHGARVKKGLTYPIVTKMIRMNNPRKNN